jgi:hypothetical protein
MDVIGDEPSTVVKVTRALPGSPEYRMGTRRSMIVLITGAVVMAGGFLGGLASDSFMLGVGVAFGTLLSLMSTSYVCTGLIVDWTHLYADYRKLRAEALHLLEQHTYAAGFIDTFKPPQGDVERVLTERAYSVLKVHELKVKFYAKGAGDYGKNRVHLDPEDEAHRLQVAADVHKEQVERDILLALENFRRARDLAKNQGYTVHESWKDYISPDILPRQLKRSAPGAAFPFPTQPGEADVSAPVVSEGTQ